MLPLGVDRKLLKLIQRMFKLISYCVFPEYYISTYQLAIALFSIICSNGKAELEIKFPAEQVTSAAFGGPNLDILFVTTAATERSGPQPKPAGNLFKVTGLGAKGLAGVKTRL